MKYMVIAIVALVGISLLMVATGFIKLKKDDKMPIAADEKQIEMESEKYTAWAVYWDLDTSMPEVEKLDNRLEGISCFAAYFDQNNKLILPDTITAFHQELRSKKDIPTYLTIVNDQKLQDGSSNLKSTSVLKKIFASTQLTKAHRKEIIDLAMDNGYDGIEIDYEAIRQDVGLWKSVLSFSKSLYDEAQQKGLSLRVILEPNCPVESLTFPMGPEYMMMCYNLYGTLEQKGPKADDAFLKELVYKMSSLPGKKGFIIAGGGYVWKNNEKGKQLTETKAVELANSNHTEASRDPNSQAMTFSYVDRHKDKYEVWYADVTTLKHWAELLRAYGDFDIGIWRLGGNVFQ